MKKILQEPLVHFLTLGLVLFGVYALVVPDERVRPDEIVVSAGRIENLAATFAKVWQRPPTGEELKGLIDTYVQEEALSREAIKLGLDQNDTVIRRRLQQKMEFLAEDFAASMEPSDEELSQYLERHPEKFRLAPQFTLEQVYLNPNIHGNRLDAVATATLQTLRSQESKASWEALGDPTLLPRDMHGASPRTIAGQFGEAFAGSLNSLPLDAWSGPIPSAYGVHLVRIHSRTMARLPDLAAVKEDVKRELLHDRRQTAQQAFLKGLLSKYPVRIEWPTEQEGLPLGDTALNP